MVSENTDLEEPKPLSRRDFFKSAWLGAGAFALILKGLDKLQESSQYGWPKFQIEIGYHYDWQFGPQERGGVERADVVMLEWAGWNNSTLEHLEKISSGQQTLEEIQEADANVPFNNTSYDEALYGKGKDFYIIGIPEGHPLWQEWNRLKPLQLPNSSGIDFTKPFSENVQNLETLLRAEAHFHYQREVLMLDEIENAFADLRKKYPLRERMHIFIPLGAWHTGMYHELKLVNQNYRPEVSRRFSEIPLIWSQTEEAMRRYRFIEDPSGRYRDVKSPTQKDIARIAFERVLDMRFRSRFEAMVNVLSYPEDWSKLSSILRSVAKKFSYQEVSDIFNELGEEHKRHPEVAGYDSLPEFDNILERHLEEKGIFLPEVSAQTTS